MRIDMVGLWYKPVVGGTETFMEVLVEGLTRKGHDLTVHTSLLDRSGAEIEGDTPGVRRYSPFLWSRRLLVTYAKIFRADLKGADIVWPQTWARGASDYNAYIAKHLGIPTVLTANDADYPAPTRMGQTTKDLYDRVVSKVVAKFYDWVVPETDYDRPFFRRLGIPDEKIVTIPSGIGEGPFRRRGTGALDKYGLDRLGYLLYVGRVDWEKSVGDLIRAAKGLGMPVVVGGKGPEVEPLEALARELGVDARFLGFLSEDDKLALMENAFCFVNPSRHEAFGLTPLEAYASGCPVIASRVGGVPYVFGEDRVLFYEYGNVADLREKLGVMRKNRDEYEPDIEYARGFSWQNTIDRYDELFERVASDA